MRRMNDPDRWNDMAKHYEETAHPFTAPFAEAALARIRLTPQTRLLDVATGTGALALAAAWAGAQVLATDFSPGMVARVTRHGLPNLEGRTMDGQALDLPDASFDAVFSVFGVMMFPDWRRGLAEMARVTRPGGHGVVATWQSKGAATHLLLGEVVRGLFPEREWRTGLPEGLTWLGKPDTLSAEMVAAGFDAPAIETMTSDYLLRMTNLDPETQFGLSEDWGALGPDDQQKVIDEVYRRAGGRNVLPVPSTALIAVARR
ncbi:ubiquinone/menaquinone biosynthesis C-methylase UbiE [Sphingomonas naasensis]|uniref:Class I SAM-dependent methyltransferase n=1 Tax=Sphingomonas naasensis TaxID=1344951 RepID=A0A4S1WDJ1_9SPHN|nr:class I SAM-dependent methyltransferase [Sphingomonas naasensis]NIJ19741.1 ubiquinone/menaquinone biosynthesis C-methylase UbiE [Sphingomonas naasensis]TGX40115.1 class I SAM-dependent methyltransferase [Sphingomonas naasensis]